MSFEVESLEPHLLESILYFAGLRFSPNGIENSSFYQSINPLFALSFTNRKFYEKLQYLKEKLYDKLADYTTSVALVESDIHRPAFYYWSARLISYLGCRVEVNHAIKRNPDLYEKVKAALDSHLERAAIINSRYDFGNALLDWDRLILELTEIRKFY